MKGYQLPKKTGQAKDVFDLMYPDNTASCYVCHDGSPGAITPYGNMYIQAGGTKLGTMSAFHAIESMDADNDGINNGLEIRTGTNPNVANAINGKIASNPQGGDILVSDSSVLSVYATPIQDLYAEFGVTLADGQQLLSEAQFSYTQNTIAPVTVAFTKASAYGTVKVHELTSAGISQEIPSTVTSFGNITFTASTSTPKIVVESTIDPMEGSSSSGGCLAVTSLPLSILLLFFLLFLHSYQRKNEPQASIT